jgi:hypothetical protein
MHRRTPDAGRRNRWRSSRRKDPYDQRQTRPRPLSRTSSSVSSGRSGPRFVIVLLFLPLVGTAAAFVAWFTEARKSRLDQLTASTFLVPVVGIVLAAQWYSVSALADGLAQHHVRASCARRDRASKPGIRTLRTTLSAPRGDVGSGSAQSDQRDLTPVDGGSRPARPGKTARPTPPAIGLHQTVTPSAQGFHQRHGV